MHVPIGVSGVQAVPNTLHSHGLSTPLSTSPHWHAFGSATRTPGHGEDPLGVELRVRLAHLQRRVRDEAQARATRSTARSSMTSSITSSARGLPSHGTTRRVLVLDLAAALGELDHQLVDRLQDVQRLEPGDHQRLAVARRR